MNERKISLIDLIQDSDIGTVLKQPTPGAIINYSDDNLTGNGFTEDNEAMLEKEAVGLTSLHTSDIPSNASHRTRNTQSELEEDLDVAMSFFGGSSHMDSPDANPPINIGNISEKTINNKDDLTDKADSLSWPNKFFNKVTLGEKMNKEQRSIKKLYSSLSELGFNSKAEEVLGLLNKTALEQASSALLTKSAEIDNGDKDPKTAMASLKASWDALKAAIDGQAAAHPIAGLAGAYLYKTEDRTSADVRASDFEHWETQKAIIDGLCTNGMLAAAPANAFTTAQYFKLLDRITRAFVGIIDKEKATEEITIDGQPGTRPWATLSQSRRRGLSPLLQQAPLFWTKMWNSGVNTDLTDFLRMIGDHRDYYKSRSRQHKRSTTGIWRYGAGPQGEIIYIYFKIADENAAKQMYETHIYTWYPQGHPKHTNDMTDRMTATPGSSVENGTYNDAMEHIRANGFTHRKAAELIEKKSFIDSLNYFKISNATLQAYQGEISPSSMNLQTLKNELIADRWTFTVSDPTGEEGSKEVIITVQNKANELSPFSSATYSSPEGVFKSSKPAKQTSATQTSATQTPATQVASNSGDIPSFDSAAVTEKGHKIEEYLPQNSPDKEKAFRRWVVKSNDPREIKRALSAKDPKLTQKLGVGTWRNGYTSTAWEIWGDAWLTTIKPDLFKEEAENADEGSFSSESVLAFILSKPDFDLWSETKPEASQDNTRVDILKKYPTLKVLLDPTSAQNRAEKLKKLKLISGVPALMDNFERALQNAQTASRMSTQDLNTTLSMHHAEAIVAEESGPQAAGSAPQGGQSNAGNQSVNLVDSVYYNTSGQALLKTVDPNTKAATISVAPGTILTMKSNGNSYVMSNDGKLRPLYMRSGSPFLTEDEKKKLLSAAQSQGGGGDWAQFLTDVTKVWKQRVDPKPGFWWDDLETNIDDLRKGTAIGSNYVSSAEFKKFFPNLSSGNSSTSGATDASIPVARNRND